MMILQWTRDVAARAHVALLVLASLMLLNHPFRLVSGYCTSPLDTCWPTEKEWDALREDVGGRLHEINETDYGACLEVEPSMMATWTLLEAAHGICMQYHNTAHRYGDPTLGWNLPFYSIEAESVKDVQKALNFAQKHDLAVSVKNTGHSYSGSSTMAGTLMIWMNKLDKYGNTGPHTDMCGTVTDESIRLGAGQTWYEAYAALSDKHYLVGGGGKSVGCCGGWLMGGGLSALSPIYGLGIDNVLQFEAVLANGTIVTVDACSHPDLFWALRGGGGGSFAVVTAVHYRLHPASPMVELHIFVNTTETGDPSATEALRAFYHKWVDVNVEGLDRRWGGYWQFIAGYGLLYFFGTEAEARATLVTDLEDWKEALPQDQGERIAIFVVDKPLGFVDDRTSNMGADVTGNEEFFIGSRLVPEAAVIGNNGADGKALLDALLDAGLTEFSAYQLGGKVLDIAADATAVSPVMRSAVWAIMSERTLAVSYLQQNLRDSAPCYNHHQANEPGDWAEAFWGANLPRLNAIKAAYDPERRLNCWHCVGFQDFDVGAVVDDDSDDAQEVSKIFNASVSAAGATLRQHATELASAVASLAIFLLALV